MDNCATLVYPPARSAGQSFRWTRRFRMAIVPAPGSSGRGASNGGTGVLQERRFTNLVLWGGALLALLGAGFASPWGRPVQNVSPQAAMITTSLLALAACLALSTRLPLSARITVSMSLITVLVVLYSAEAFFRWRISSQVRRAANRLGRPYDSRTRHEVLRDLRREGKDAWPVVFTKPLLPQDEELPLLPLGGISGVPTVHCNEIGTSLIYASDEHGFHNPAGVWDKAPLEVALLGDSFALGNCVGSEENAAARIRMAYPATLNLGVEAAGPLLELATLKEYLPELRPRRIVWLYYEGNDLISDLNEEKSSAQLMKYLEGGYRQGLANRQDEVDRFWKARVTEVLGKVDDSARGSRVWQGHLLAWSRLRTLRGMVGLQLSAPGPDFSGVDLVLFGRILESARDAAHSWGGRVYFAYLPAEVSLRSRRPSPADEELRRTVLRMVQELGIPLIDLLPVLQREKDPDSLYAFRGAHFSPKGYAVVGDAIVSALKEEAR